MQSFGSLSTYHCSDDLFALKLMGSKAKWKTAVSYSCYSSSFILHFKCLLQTDAQIILAGSLLPHTFMYTQMQLQPMKEMEGLQYFQKILLVWD